MKFVWDNIGVKITALQKKLKKRIFYLTNFYELTNDFYYLVHAYKTIDMLVETKGFPKEEYLEYRVYKNGTTKRT